MSDSITRQGRALHFSHRKAGLVAQADISPFATLADYLDHDQILACTGTAHCMCTVIVARLAGDRLSFRAARADALCLVQIDGSHVLDIGDLAAAPTGLQDFLKSLDDGEGGGTACPAGTVMRLWALSLAQSGRTQAGRAAATGGNGTDKGAGGGADNGQDEQAISLRTRPDSAEWLDTPVSRAARHHPMRQRLAQLCAAPPVSSRAFMAHIRTQLAARTGAAGDIMRTEPAQGAQGAQGTQKSGFFARPVRLESFAALLDENHDAGLARWPGSHNSVIDLPASRKLIDPSCITRLQQAVPETLPEGDGLEIGSILYGEALLDVFAMIDPALLKFARRTCGAELLSGGFIATWNAAIPSWMALAPALVALKARVNLMKRAHMRTVRMEDFFPERGQIDLAPGEFITSLSIPFLQAGQHFFAWHMRWHALNGAKNGPGRSAGPGAAFLYRITDGRIADVRIALGSRTGRPVRAPRSEAALCGARLAVPGDWSDALQCIACEAPDTEAPDTDDTQSVCQRSLLIKSLVELSTRPDDRRSGDPDTQAGDTQAGTGNAHITGSHMQMPGQDRIQAAGTTAGPRQAGPRQAGMARAADTARNDR